MRVAYVINQYPKVSHTFIRREVLELERQGVEVVRVAMRGWDALCPDPKDREEQRKTRYVLRRGFFGLLLAMLDCIIRAPLAFTRAFVLIVRIGWRADRPFLLHFVYLAEACFLVRLLKKERVDHIHAHFGTNPATVSMLASLMSRHTWSLTVHGPEEFDKPQFIALPEKLKHCKFAVAISSFGRGQLYRLVDHSLWSKIFVVRCGVEPSLFEAFLPSVMKNRKIVCIGRFAEQKGQMLLLQAVKLIREQGESINLVLIGDGELREDLNAFIEENGLQDAVHITGWLATDQVLAEIVSSRLTVVPSLAEGLPVVIIESMGAGRPVLSTYIAGIPELINSKENGWLVPAADLQALTERLVEALNSRDEILLAMSKNAQAAVKEKHNLTTEVGKLIELFGATAVNPTA